VSAVPPSVPLLPPPAPAPPPPPAGSRAAHRPLIKAAIALAGAACLVTAVLAGRAARAEQTRPPTTAERSAAAAAAVAGRWQAWRAGRIFPATLGYVSNLRTRENARRVGIAAADGCAAALTGPLVAAARADGCHAALRATYLDQLEGVVYTTGVLAFPTPRRAAAFASAAGHRALPAGLRAFGPAGTAAARFTDAARQAWAVRQAGPYVLVTVAGYTDGRAAAATGERRPSVFAPAGQLAQDILTPLARPAKVDCASRAWAC